MPGRELSFVLSAIELIRRKEIAMPKSTGPTYTKLRCELDRECLRFDSTWEAGECYEMGGKLVRECTEPECFWQDYETHSDFERVSAEA